jgi:hypothetical protein
MQKKASYSFFNLKTLAIFMGIILCQSAVIKAAEEELAQGLDQRSARRRSARDTPAEFDQEPARRQTPTRERPATRPARTFFTTVTESIKNRAQTLLNHGLTPLGLYRGQVPTFWETDPTSQKALTKLCRGAVGIYVYHHWVCAEFFTQFSPYDLINPKYVPNHLLNSAVLAQASLAYAEAASGALDVVRLGVFEVMDAVLGWFGRS